MQVAGFTLQEVIGRGRAGVVWRANHPDHELPVALKLLTGEAARSTARVRRFVREAHAAAALHHPGIVGVYAYGLTEDPVGDLPGGTPYLAMEHVEDASLAAHVGKLGWSQLRTLALALLDALAHAHARRVVHRDLHPARIRAADDLSRVKIGGFGLAGLTGAPGYDAPEQREGRWRDFGPWTDLYGLGVLLRTLASGDDTIPAGLLDWIGVLEDPERGGRFSRAADAAHALRALDGPIEMPLGRAPVTPFIEDWRRLEPSGLHAVRVGGLRHVPFVGRTRIRDLLWTRMSEAATSGRPRAIVLSGPPGVGKTRLAEWLAHRAHELGAASVLRAVYGETGGPAQGLGRMLGRFLGCPGLSGEPLVDRLHAQLRLLGADDRDAAAALAEVIEPGDTPRIESLRERFAVVCSVLRPLAWRRPVLVLLDDVQHGPEACALAVYALQALEAPVLLVLTARPEAPLDALERAGVERVGLSPLDPSDCHALLVDALALDVAVADDIGERSGGNPLFALRLVDEWIRSGAIEPETVHELWSERLSQLFGASPQGRTALELAATLGGEVDEAEWRAVCADARLDAPDAVLETALGHALARRDPLAPDTWAFAHPLLREALLVDASERLTDHHRCCATVLERAHRPGTARRLGRHLLAAGDAAGSVGPFLQAIRRRFAEGDHDGARVVLSEIERALASLDNPERHPGWAQARVLTSRLERFEGDLGAADRTAKEARRVSYRRGWERTWVDALVELAEIAHERGRYEEAAKLLEEACAASDVLGDQRRAARCRHRLGVSLLGRGSLTLAVRACEDARTDFVAVGDTVEAARCELLLARILQQAGELEKALNHAQAARRLFTRSSARQGVAQGDNLVGEIARQTGDLEGAERAYRGALLRWETIGHSHAMFARANLGLITLERGDLAAAHPLLRRSLEQFEREGRTAITAQVLAALLPCEAARGDWAAFDARAMRVSTLVDETGLADADTARMAERAGTLAAAAGHRERALFAWKLAATQYRGLGRAEDARALEARLTAL